MPNYKTKSLNCASIKSLIAGHARVKINDGTYEVLSRQNCILVMYLRVSLGAYEELSGQ